MYNKAEELAEEALHGAEEVRAERVGLDLRAAYRLWVGEDFIACRASEDRTLQYYGGFEYVEKEHRQEVGGYVFYSTESERVLSHFEMLDR